MSREKRQKSQTSSLSAFGLRVVSAYEGRSIREISEELEISYDKLRNYLVGRSDIPTEELVKIAKKAHPPTSIDWLLTGEEPTKTQDARLEKNVGPEHDVTIHKEDLRHLEDTLDLHDPEIRKIAAQEGIPRGHVVFKLVREALIARGLLAERIRPMEFKVFTGRIVMVPLVGRVAAGKPIERYEDGRLVPCGQVWPDHWNVQAVEVAGDSMSGDDIFDGDLVFYRVVNEFKPNDMVIVQIEGEGVSVKRVRRGSNGMVRLESSNPDFETMTYEASRLELLGVVIATQKLKRS